MSNNCLPTKIVGITLLAVPALQAYVQYKEWQSKSYSSPSTINEITKMALLLKKRENSESSTKEKYLLVGFSLTNTIC